MRGSEQLAGLEVKGKNTSVESQVSELHDTDIVAHCDFKMR